MKKFSTFVLSLILCPSLALGATGSGVLTPITKVARDVRSDLTGEMGRELILIFVAIAAVTWMGSEHGHGGRKVAAVFIGAALLMGGAQIVNALGWTGAIF